MATVETLEKLERRITINIPRDEVQAEVDKRLKVRARTAKAPGFRPGKVPMKMVAAQYEPDIRAYVLNEKISEAIGKSVEENKLQMAGHPRVEAKKDDVPEDQIGFYAIFEVYPEVHVGDLSTVEIERVKTAITDKEIDNTIDVLRKRQAHYHAKGEAGEHGDGGPNQSAQKGDRVTIDFTGSIDGVEFPGGKAEDFAFVMGEGQMLADFENAVAGMKAGESKTFQMTFPENYHGKDVAGKAAEFAITVKKVEWAHLPAIDAEFIKGLGVASGETEAMRTEIRENLTRESDTRIKSLNKENLMNALDKVAQFDLPKALIEQELEGLMESARQRLSQNGRDPKTIKLPPALFSAQAERRVKMGLLFNKLIESHDLKASPEQVRAHVELMAKSYQDPKMVIDYYYGTRERLEEVESMVLEDNVMNFVLGQAKVTEKVVPFDELMGPPAA